MAFNIAEHPYIDKWRASGYQYYQIPKGMLNRASQFGLVLDDILLYCILKDRTSLSGANGWVDDMGRIYIIYTRDSAAQYIRCSKRRVIEGFKRLVKAGLLVEVEQANKYGNLQNTPKKLYVKMWTLPENTGMELDELKETGFPCITQDNIDFFDDNYYVIPRILFEGEDYQSLSTRAIMIYCMALDKLHVSINYNRIDENGFVWCGLDADALAKELNCSVKSIWRTYKELEDIGLIVRKRAGYATKYQYRFYLRDYLPSPVAGTPKDVDLSPLVIPDFSKKTVSPSGPDNLSHRSGQIVTPDRTDHNPGPDKLLRWDDQKVTPDQTNCNTGADKLSPIERTNCHSNYLLSQSLKTNTLISNIDDSAHLRRLDVALRSKNFLAMSLIEAFSNVQRQLHYETLCEDITYVFSDPEDQQYAAEYLMISIELMAKDMIFPGTRIRFGNELIDKTDVLVNYSYISEYILLTMLKKVVERRTEIKNMNLYLHRALYAAWENHEGEAYFTEAEIAKQKGLQ